MKKLESKLCISDSYYMLRRQFKFVKQGSQVKTYKKWRYNPKLTSQSYANTKKLIQMAHQFTTAPTFPNLYMACNINNIDLTLTLNR